MSSIVLFLVGIAAVFCAYLIGSIPFAVLVSRGMGLQDPRTFGSKNPGATNVLRSGNKAAAILTLCGDAAKGWLAVWLAERADLPPVVVALCAIAVFLGHLYPIFLGFKGGKGVATALGVLLALQPLLAIATVATWLIVAFASRYSSLAAIAAAIFTPLYYLFGGNVAWPFDPLICSAIVVICVIVCFRHKANIARLMVGKESRIGGDKARTGPHAR